MADKESSKRNDKSTLSICGPKRNHKSTVERPIPILKITNIKLDLSTKIPSLTSTQFILPSKIPSEINSYSNRSKPHTDFRPSNHLNWISTFVGFNINLSKSIGSGSYAKCFTGSRLSTGTSTAHSAGEQTICVKITDVDRLSSNYRYNFLPRENFALTSLSGPYLVKTFETLLIDIVLHDNSVLNYFVTLQELLLYSLHDLAFDRKNVKRIIPFDVIRRIGVQLIDRVVLMHEKGISHRDLKIGNLMLDEQFKLKIIDFGLCHLSNSQSNSSTIPVDQALVSETWCGTKVYFSPELILRLEYSPKLYDSWLSGMVIYELVNKQLPDIFDHVSRNGHFDPKFISFDSSPPQDLMSLIRQLLVVESNRATVNNCKEHKLYTDYDESQFLNDYNCGKIQNISDVLSKS